MGGFNVIRAPGEIAGEKNNSIYGKLVDQHGNAIADAQVWYYSSHFDVLAVESFGSGTGYYKTKTDKNGRFKCSKRGRYIRIREIKKDGYDPLNPGAAGRAEDAARKINSNNKKDPLVFKMRKRGKPAYLVGGKCRVWCDKGKSASKRFRMFERCLDQYGMVRLSVDPEKLRQFNSRKELLERGMTVEQLHPTMQQEPQMNFDIKITCISHGETNDWDVIFDYMGKDGGVFLGDKILYQAPDKGYVSQSRVTYKSGRITSLNGSSDAPAAGKSGYLYVKSHGGRLYSKIKFEIRDGRYIAVSGDYLTNPDGSRNLEYDYNKVAAQPRIELAKRFKTIRDQAWAKYHQKYKVYKNYIVEHSRAKRNKQKLPVIVRKPIQPDEDKFKQEFIEMVDKERSHVAGL